MKKLLPICMETFTNKIIIDLPLVIPIIDDLFWQHTYENIYKLSSCLCLTGGRTTKTYSKLPDFSVLRITTNYKCSIPVTQQFSDKLKINPECNKSVTFSRQSLCLDKKDWFKIFVWKTTHWMVHPELPKWQKRALLDRKTLQ